MLISRFKTRRWPRALVALGMLIGLVITASPASADAPIVTHFSDTAAATIAGGGELCPFDVEITATIDGTERDYVDRSGQLTRIAFHFVEQDTFEANGHQLVGDPFHNIQQVLFDENGNVVHVYEVGVIERVPLPSGALFLSAGRLDFVEHNFDFVFTPDQGHSGDLAALCAALAP